MLRDLTSNDLELLCDQAAATQVFYDHEITTLRDVLDDYLHHARDDYGHVCRVWLESKPLGFVYYAPVEMTDRTWELWWIVVDPNCQGRGIGQKMLKALEADLESRNQRLLLIETSSLPRYESARQFYLKAGYVEAARVKDFYTSGDDKVIFWKSFEHPKKS